LAPNLRAQISEAVVPEQVCQLKNYKHFSIASFATPGYEPAGALVALIHFLPFLIIPSEGA
jgi:hypothetical protein